MFGLFALGIFSVFAFSGIFGNKEKSGSKSEGGFGSKILGFLGVKSLSDIFSSNGNTTASSLKDDKDNKDSKDDKSDSDIDFNKSLALIQQQIDNEKDETKKTQLEKDYNEMLGCVYDEQGNKLSQEQIQKNLESKPEFKKKLEKQALIASKDEKIAKQFKENISNIDDIQAIKAGEKAVISHLETVKKKKLEDAKDDEEQKKRIEAEYDALISTHKSNIESIEKTSKEIEELNKEKTALNAEDAVKKEIEKCANINWEKSDVSAGDLTREVGEDGEGKEKKKAAEEFLKSQGVDVELYKKYEAVKGSIDDGEKIEDNEDLKKAAEEAVKKKKEEIDKQISDKNKEIENTVKQQKPEKKKEPDNKGSENNEEVELLDDEGEKTGEKIIKKADGSYVKVDKDGKESDATEEEFNDAKSEYEEGDGDEENSQEDNDADKDLDTNYEESDDEKNSEEGKKAERDESGKRVNPAKVWHKRKKKDGKGSTKSYYNSKGDSISGKEFREKMENYKSYVSNHKKTTQQDKNSLNISNFLKDKLIIERFYPHDITNYLKEHLR